MLSAQSFGFWTYMFNKLPFNAGGKSLLDVFPKKQIGLRQRMVYNELKGIKLFRNRIAHYEPICFDSRGNKCLFYAMMNYKQIVKYLEYLGYNEKRILYGFDVQTQKLMSKIMTI